MQVAGIPAHRHLPQDASHQGPREETWGEGEGQRAGPRAGRPELGCGEPWCGSSCCAPGFRSASQPCRGVCRSLLRGPGLLVYRAVSVSLAPGGLSDRLTCCQHADRDQASGQ